LAGLTGGDSENVFDDDVSAIEEAAKLDQMQV
jgi:hypothetical protein